MLTCKMCWAKTATRFVRDTDHRVCSGCYYIIERTLNYLYCEAPSVLDPEIPREENGVSKDQLRFDDLLANQAEAAVAAGQAN